MRVFAALALGSACLASSPLWAADLFGDAPPPDMPPQQEELGANWYIRGDVGYGEINQAEVLYNLGLFPTVGNMPIGDPATPVNTKRGDSQTTWTPAVGLGFGYRVNDWFRMEADWTFSKGPGRSVTKTVFCPQAANAVSNNNISTVAGVPTITSSAPVGYAYDYTTCDGHLNLSQYNNTGLVWGYADLGHYGLFTPYVGVGGGLNVNNLSGTLVYNETTTGAPYTGAVVAGTAPAQWVTPTGTDKLGNPVYSPLQGVNPSSGVPQPIGPANWNRTINSTKYTFALAAAAGLGIKVSQSATLDLGYKFMTLDLTNGVHGVLQTVNLGVRYDLN